LLQLTVSEPSTVWGKEPGGAEWQVVEAVHLDGHGGDSSGEGKDVTEGDLLLLG
jgi:hypothetical protein